MRSINVESSSGARELASEFNTIIVQSVARARVLADAMRGDRSLNNSGADWGANDARISAIGDSLKKAMTERTNAKS
jgi:hypothetical protein